jgi:hypothetical protein
MKARLAKKVTKNPERYHPHQVIAAIGRTNRRIRQSLQGLKNLRDAQ